MKTQLPRCLIAALCTVWLTGTARADAPSSLMNAAPVAMPTDAPVATPVESLIVIVPNESTSCVGGKGAGERTVEQLESLNDQIWPVRDVIGYVKSPQSLVLKLVNDHVVTIPAWFGFLLDPIGTIRNKAMDEARNQARSTLKAALIPENRCAPEAPATLVGPSGPPDDITPHFPRGNPFTQT